MSVVEVKREVLVAETHAVLESLLTERQTLKTTHDAAMKEMDARIDRQRRFLTNVIENIIKHQP